MPFSSLRSSDGFENFALCIFHIKTSFILTMNIAWNTFDSIMPQSIFTINIAL